MRTHLMVFGVSRLQEVVDKGNPWYVQAYEEGFDRVTFAYPLGKPVSLRQGQTELVSLGTGNYWGDWLLAPWRLYKIAQEIKPTTYMTADQWYAWWLGLLLRWRLGARIVLMPVAIPEQLYADRGVTVSGWPYWVDRLLQRLSFATSSRVWTAKAFGGFVAWLSADPRARHKLVVTESIVEALPSWFIRSLQPGLHDVGEAFQIVYVGRLHPEKLVDHLIRMMAHLPDAYELTLVGDGPARAALETLANDLGVAPRIQFKGAQPTESVAAYLAMSDVFASTLTGSSLREAALLGLPIVAYDRDWVHGLLEHEETALLCQSGDVAGLARAVARLKDDRPLAARLSTNARLLAEDLWTLKNVRASLHQVAARAA
jgi:glycosyltransferase involved in cell wall biosynthesis